MKVLWWWSINIIFQNCYFCLLCCKFWVLLSFMIIKLVFFFILILLPFCILFAWIWIFNFLKKFSFPSMNSEFFYGKRWISGYHSVKSNQNPIPFCVLNLIWSMFDPIILQTHKTRQLLLYYSFIYIIKWIWHLPKNLINIYFFVQMYPLILWIF